MNKEEERIGLGVSSDKLEKFLNLLTPGVSILKGEGTGESFNVQLKEVRCGFCAFDSDYTI